MATTIIDFATALTVLGNHLKVRRQALGLSQQALAGGLCAQTMIGNIEKGIDLPNANLLAKLCERLRLPHNQMLKENYPIRRLPSFSDKVHRLCDQQRYADLKAYMERPGRLQVLTTDEDLKTYYYYYGWAVYQATHDVTAGLRSIRTALTMMMPQHPQNYRTLEVLLFSTENYMTAATTRQPNYAGFERALAIIHEQRLIDSSQNLCMVFNQYARICLAQGQSQRAIQVLIDGIAWADAHESTYMLADNYILLAQAYALTQQVLVDQRLGAVTTAMMPTTRQQIY